MTKKRGYSKKVLSILGIVIILATSALIFSYRFFGIGNIFDAKQVIESLEEKDRLIAYDMLSSKPGNLLNAGLVLRLNGKNEFKGIWIWNKDGFKYYKAGDNVTLNSFSICEDRNWEKPSAQLGKNANINYDAFRRKVHNGDYVQILLSDKRLINDITVYDWWAFVPTLPFSYFELTCKNR